ESQCPGSTKQCHGVNEEVVPCAKPKSCNTCGIRGNCKLKKCDEGCDCKPGYYRDDTGTCIPESQCPRSKKLPCPENQTYYDCMPSCKRTCMTYNSTVACSTTECLKGCFCKGDHLVMNKNGECIPPEECPVSCPLNQMYYECMPNCQNRCHPPDVCTADCRSGCFCKEGLFMRDDGKCVRKEVCDQHICGPDEKCDSGESEEESNEVITRESETSSTTYSTSGSTKETTTTTTESKTSGEEPGENPKPNSEGGDGESEEESNEVITRESETSSSTYSTSGSTKEITTTTIESKTSNEEPGQIPIPKSGGGDGESVEESNEVITRESETSSYTYSTSGSTKETTTTDSKTSDEEPGANPKPKSGGGATCGKNEEYNECGSGCVPTCSDAGICDLHTLQCFPGCYCKEGMVRNDQGECVSPEECNQSE
ncbi:zonadhesin, partial [Caerostris darwini]